MRKRQVAKMNVNRKIQDITNTIMERIIMESAMDEVANYPQNFSMDDFKKLRSFSQRVNYCEQRLKRLGSGSVRIVYLIDDTTVLKLAKNNKGIAQNRAEAEDSYARDNELTTEVYDTDENYLWVEMQFARRAKADDFRKLTGHDFKFMCGFIDFVHSWYGRYTQYGQCRDAEKYEEFLESDEYEYSFFWSLADYMNNFQLEAIGDLKRPSSWGVVKDKDGSERIVIVDMGLNDDVYGGFYKR